MATRQIDFTVVIPTYNGEKKVGAVLDSLKLQQFTQNLNWEIIVIDNNSTDNTAKLIHEYQENWQEDCQLKYFCEEKQGAAFARKRGIKEANSSLVGFLDDDNLPHPDWVQSAYDFAEQYPQAGAYGSRVNGDYEIEPPENFERIASFFAITNRGAQPHLYQPAMKILPTTAGLVVRKQAWQANVPDKSFLSGRSDQSILNSEDLEVILYIQNAGWEIWYNPDMQIDHKIPRSRLERKYLLFLMHSTGLARHYIRMLRFKPWQRPLIFPFGLANDTRKAIFYFLRNWAILKQDTVAACEMQFLWSSVMSPFYLWSKSFK